MKRFLKYIPALVLAAVAVLGAPRASNAAFSVVVKENGATVDTYSFPSPGQFNISKSYADFNLIFTAVSSNAPGSNVQGELKFSSLDVTSNVSATNTIEVLMSDTFSNPGSAGTTMTLTNALTVVAQTAGSNPVDVTSTGGAVTTPNVHFDGGSTPYAGSSMAQFVRGSTYGLSQDLKISLSGHGDITLQTDTSAAVPAPASVILLLAGVGPLGLWLRRRMA
jgi:hypothetical protein